MEPTVSASSAAAVTSAADGAAAGASDCRLEAGPAVEWPVTVTDASGAAIRGAQVQLTCGMKTVTSETGASGQATLRLQPGSWVLTVQAPGFAQEELPVTVAAKGDGATVKLRVGSATDTVRVTGDAKFAVNATDAGLKMELPLMETPQAITVVNRDLLDSQGAVKLDDALKNVAGVIPGGYYDGWDYYRIRGFDASFNTYIDGLRGGNGMMEETWGLESVEVLKGPSSALYGQSVLGGLVNIVTRKPVPVDFAHVQFTAGSYNFMDPAVDIGGTLNPSHTLYGRLAALYHTGDTFVDYTNRHRYYLAPSLTWKPAPGTSLTLIGRVQRDNGRQAMPLPAVGTVLPNINGKIAISRYIGELEDYANKISQANQQFGYQFVQGLGKHFSLHQDARFAWYQQHWTRIYYPDYLAPDERTLYRYPYSYDGPWQTHEVDTHLEGTSKFWKMDHTAMVGFDFYRSPSNSTSEMGFEDEPLDLFAPVYGAHPVQTLTSLGSSASVTQYAGIYLQDHIRLPKNLTVTGGGRLDIAKNETKGLANQNGRGWTPRMGVTWQAIPSTMVYASFSKSYLPQSGHVYEEGSSSGTYLPPERGQQWEGGAKSALWNGRVTTTLAVFQLNRNNVATTDASHPNYYVVTGEQRSRGVEFEATLHPLTGLNMTTAYSYVNAEVVFAGDDPHAPGYIAPGTPTQNAPRNLLNVWGNYEFPRGLLRGLGFGAGGRHYTDQAGDTSNSFQLPGYGVVDASASYKRGHSNWQVNAYNLGDTRYAAGSYSKMYVNPGEPRTIRGTVSWNF